jgi:predicted TIM-barrel fold metal-dependent hydrolase
MGHLQVAVRQKSGFFDLSLLFANASIWSVPRDVQSSRSSAAAHRRGVQSRGNVMKGKICLEEHFAIEATLGDSQVFGPHVWPELRERLVEIQTKLLAQMDSHGVARTILSLNAPAVQAISDRQRAVAVAKEANDVLAEHVRKRPDRFSGFAALPMQDPEAACRELERCVKELKFVGALVNGFSESGDPDNLLYYDLPQYKAFWKQVEALDVPFYLHPRNPLPQHIPGYMGHNWLLGPNWAFSAETSVHALRLIGSGLFDECPNLKIVLGHLGEGIPALLWRIDHRNGWMKAPHKYAARKPVAEYFRKHFWLTTSGNYNTSALKQALEELGADRIMFSIDWPFEDPADACDWIDRAPIPESERELIARGNAQKLFRLPA